VTTYRQVNLLSIKNIICYIDTLLIGASSLFDEDLNLLIAFKRQIKIIQKECEKV